MFDNHKIDKYKATQVIMKSIVGDPTIAPGKSKVKVVKKVGH